MTKHIELSKIRTDGGTQMRAELDRDVYFDYRDKWLAGEKFPPIVLFHDGSTYWLADGFHRFYGAREAKMEKIPADVRQGTVRDAILFAVSANHLHGLRRTDADKRRAVESLLSDAEWVLWSDEIVSEKCCVSRALVTKIRSELAIIASSEVAKAADKPRVGKDGKRRKPPKPKAAKPPPPKQEPPDRNKRYVVPDDDDSEGDESASPKPSGGIAPGVVPLLDAQKAADEIFAPLNKAEREELFEYIEFRYGPKN